MTSLREAITSTWSAETAHDPETWTPERPSTGQCYVTSMIIQDEFGGDIVAVKVPEGRHFYNVVDGMDIDMTRDQFNNYVPLSKPKVVQRKSLTGRTAKRYRILRDAVDQCRKA